MRHAHQEAAQNCFGYGNITVMAGRKHKGDRELFAGRIPSDVAAACREEMAERGMSMTDYIAAVMAERHGLANRAPMQPARKDSELPMTG